MIYVVSIRTKFPITWCVMNHDIKICYCWGSIMYIHICLGIIAGWLGFFLISGSGSCPLCIKRASFKIKTWSTNSDKGWRDVSALQLYRFLLPANIRSWEFRFGPSQQQITRNWKGRINFKKCFTSTDRKKPCPSAKGRVYLIIYICYLKCSSLT